MSEGTTVLTLSLDAASQAAFERQRRAHFPPELNRIPAHITLFHTLALQAETATVLASVAEVTASFPMRVQGLRSLGRGVAYTLASPDATALHTKLESSFADELTAQDRQRFQPHVVVQNKVQPETAARLLAELQREFMPWEVEAVGLDWWEYLGGPWRHLERFSFC